MVGTEIAQRAAALQFPLAAPEVASVVSGAVSPAEIEANIGYFSTSVPNAFWSDLRAKGLVASGIPILSV